MIDLIREGAALVMAWCVGLTLTYGFVESRFPLFMGMRIAFAATRDPSPGAETWWGEDLVYCPYCIGFWIQGACGLVLDLTPWSFVRAACLWIASLLVMRSVFDVELVQSKWSAERQAIADLRKAAPGGS